MVTPTNRSILICSKIVTLENFIENFNTYFPMVSNRFRPSTLSHRSDMSDVDFAKFIFNKLYCGYFFNNLNGIHCCLESTSLFLTQL